MANKQMYAILLVLVGIFLIFKFQAPNLHENVLPDSSYCANPEDVEYTKVLSLNDETPVEYCPLDKFCDIYTASTVFDYQNFSDLEAEAEQYEGRYDCIVDDALNTQEGVNLQTQTLKSRFMCCNIDQGAGTCKPNDCDGVYTGVRDEHGCKIYGLEVCKAATNCVMVDGKQQCDPQPFINGCTWETKTEIADTYFTEFNNCGLNTEEVCGTVKKYRCTEDVEVLCDLAYDHETDEYVEGCGGYVLE